LPSSINEAWLASIRSKGEKIFEDSPLSSADATITPIELLFEEIMEFRQIAMFHDLSDLPTKFMEKIRVSALRRLTRDFRARVTEHYKNEAELKKATQVCVCALVQLFDPKTNVSDTRLSTIEPSQAWCDQIAHTVVGSGSKILSKVPDS
jgi:porphobilinogen deaminase